MIQDCTYLRCIVYSVNTDVGLGQHRFKVLLYADVVMTEAWKGESIEVIKSNL